MLFRLLKDHSSARKSSLALIGQKALQKHEMQTVGPSVSRVPSHIQGKGCVKPGEVGRESCKTLKDRRTALFLMPDSGLIVIYSKEQRGLKDWSGTQQVCVQ